MTKRIFRGTAEESKEQKLGGFLHNGAIPLMQGTEVIVQSLPRTLCFESSNEISFVLNSNRSSSLKLFLGNDYKPPRIDPAEAELIASRSIKSYGLVE